MDDLASQGQALQAQEELEQKILQGDIRYIVAKRNTRGFTIKLNKPTPEDLKFSWSALTVKDAKTHSSAYAESVQAAQASEPIPSPSPSSSSSSSPVVEATGSAAAQN